MSVRLFDIPHRKNSTVTSENSTIRPTGNPGRSVSPCVFAPALIDVETCMHHPSKIHFHWQTNFGAHPAAQKKVMPVYLRPPLPEIFASVLPSTPALPPRSSGTRSPAKKTVASSFLPVILPLSGVE